MGWSASIWRAQSVSVLWRWPCCAWYRADGARTVKKGRAQTHCAQGIQINHIKPAQAHGFDEVAVRGAHRIPIPPLTTMRHPECRSIVSSRSKTRGTPGSTWRSNSFSSRQPSRQGGPTRPIGNLIARSEAYRPSTHRQAHTVRGPGTGTATIGWPTRMGSAPNGRRGRQGTGRTWRVPVECGTARTGPDNSPNQTPTGC